jgi:hypothetical protein
VSLAYACVRPSSARLLARVLWLSMLTPVIACVRLCACRLVCTFRVPSMKASLVYEACLCSLMQYEYLFRDLRPTGMSVCMPVVV